LSLPAVNRSPFSYIVLAALLIFVSTNAYPADASDKSLIEAISTVIGGNFSLDHLGPDQFHEVKKLVEDNAIRADKLLGDKVLNSERLNLSSLYISSLLRLTWDKDPQGALQNARLYESMLNEQLKEADQWPNMEGHLKGMGMDEGNRIRRLAERRKDVKQIIAKIVAR